jgi:CRP-like cAMP-binding protein
MSEDDFALLQPNLARVEKLRGDHLFEPNQPIEWVYFLDAGIASIVSAEEGGEQLEIGICGREGLVGIPVLLGADQSPHQSFMQVGPSEALRIRSPDLVAAVNGSQSLRTLLLRYVQAFMIQTADTATANANYSLSERLARWLLMCHDRIDGDELELTHEFMAMMLAVRRSGVTVALHALESVGAIRATRGRINIVDRARLRQAAGDSYGRPETEYRRLIVRFGKSDTGG